MSTLTIQLPARQHVFYLRISNPQFIAVPPSAPMKIPVASRTNQKPYEGAGLIEPRLTFMDALALLRLIASHR